MGGARHLRGGAGGGGEEVVSRRKGIIERASGDRTCGNLRRSQGRKLGVTLLDRLGISEDADVQRRRGFLHSNFIDCA